MFLSLELKIDPLGWDSGVSSEAGICANKGLGEGFLPRREGTTAWQRRQDLLEGCALGALASKRARKPLPA